MRQQQDFREVHQQNPLKMKELQKFQNSTFDEFTNRKFIEDQKIFMELSGRLQETQNEVNCMNDYPQELNSTWKKTIEEPSHVYSGEEWKTGTRPRSEMPIWTVSQRFSHLQWRRLFQELWCRPTTISDLHFDKFPTPATFACWKIRFKTEVCTCSQFPTEAMQWIKEVELVDSVDELRSSSSTRGISMPNFEVPDARIASALNKIIHNSHFKRKISLEEQKGQEEDRFLRGR